MIRHVLLASTFLLSTYAQADCGPVKADCTTHKITVAGKETPINCGAGGTTVTGKGKVGGKHSGPVVPDGVKPDTPGMGDAGGGKVFHCVNPRDNSGEPTGADSTKGCIAVEPQVLEELKKCQGSELDIVGNDGGKGASSQASSSGSGSRGPASAGRSGTK